MNQTLQIEEDAIRQKTGPAFLQSPVTGLSNKKHSRGFWIFFTAAFFFDFGFAVYFFLFNLYLLDLHFNERVMGLIGGALTLGSVFGTLPIGILARKAGVRKCLTGLFIAAPSLGMLRAVVIWEPAQVGLAFLNGLAMCAWGVCFLPAIARLTTTENRASAFSLIFSVSIGTSAIGGAICGWLPSWLQLAGIAMTPAAVKRAILLVACGIASLGLFAVLNLQIPTPKDETAGVEDIPLHGRHSGWFAGLLRRAIKLDPFLLRFLPVMALWSAVLASFTPFANVYLSKDLHIPMVHIGLIFAVAQGVQFLMVLVSPIVFRCLGLMNGVVATQIATAVLMAMLAGTSDMRLAVPLYLTLSATQWVSSPGLYNLLMSKVPDSERSKASASTMFLNALLGAAATAGAGILFARFGYPRVLVGIAIFSAVVALLFKSLLTPVMKTASTRDYTSTV